MKIPYQLDNGQIKLLLDYSFFKAFKNFRVIKEIKKIMNILITGCAGLSVSSFRFLSKKYKIQNYWIDNINNFYSPFLK